jgi:hypothetical protein
MRIMLACFVGVFAVAQGMKVEIDSEAWPHLISPLAHLSNMPS